MNRWTSILGALLLVLMLWTGSSARAAERFDCIPMTAEAANHYDGERDQAPTGPDQGVAHHHSCCSGHQIAAPATVATVEIALSERLAPFIWREAGIPGRDPDRQLRPPMA